MTPTLPTRSLVLRPLTKATQRQVDWLRDPEVVEFSEQRHRAHTLSTQLRYIQSLQDGSHIWAITVADEDRHIGNLTAAVDQPNQIAELGILIGDKDYWNRGFGSEAWTAASTWLLGKDDGGMRKLEAGCMALNAPMRCLLSRAWSFEGEKKNHFLCNGQLSGALYYGKFR